MTSRPLVSVLMAAYNHESFVAEAVESVAAQTYRPLELRLIDDGSTDETATICRELARRYDWIRFESQPNAGVGATLNRLLQEARGDYLAFLASDDAFEKNKLRRQVEVLERDPQVLAVFSHVYEMDSQGKTRRDWSDRSWFNADWPDETALAGAMMTANRLCATTCLMRRSAAAEVGPFDPELPLVQDYDYWLRLLIRGRVAVLYDRLTRYRRHGHNLSGVDPAGSCRQTQQVIRRHLPALLAKYPENFPQIGSAYRSIASLASKCGDWETAAEFLSEYCRWFGKSEVQQTQLLLCQVQLGRREEARRTAEGLLSDRLRLRPETLDAVTRLAARLGGG